MPIDIPHVEIVEIVTCPSDNMWQDFDLTYPGLLSIINRIEEGMKIDEELDENQIYQLRDAVVELAQIGFPETSSEEYQLLNRDILFLLITDQLPENPGRLVFDPYFYHPMTNETCGIKKPSNTLRTKLQNSSKNIKKKYSSEQLQQ